MNIANCMITVMRGTSVSAYGDETDVGTPLYRHVPASVVETAKTVYDQATQRQSVVRTSLCHVPPWTDVLETDTIMREDTGDYFIIDAITRQQALIGVPPDKILTLRWRSGVSVGSD